MRAIMILLTILVVGGAIVWLIDRLFYRRPHTEGSEETQGAPEKPASQGCADEDCGIRSICPSEQILAGECKQEITYYEDEELDAFVGRDENSYSPEEVEQWRDVLYTLQAGDLLGWGQSIKHRGLVMPAAVREEFLHLAGEHHAR